MNLRDNDNVISSKSPMMINKMTYRPTNEDFIKVSKFNCPETPRQYPLRIFFLNFETMAQAEIQIG